MENKYTVEDVVMCNKTITDVFNADLVLVCDRGENDVKEYFSIKNRFNDKEVLSEDEANEVIKEANSVMILSGAEIRFKKSIKAMNDLMDRIDGLTVESLTGKLKVEIV